MCDCKRGTLDDAMPAVFRDSCVALVNSLVKQMGSDTGAPRSLCKRILHADILHKLARDESEALVALARIRPPFGSWTSAPASEDDWRDPADEISVGFGDLCDWEEQVSRWVCSSPPLQVSVCLYSFVPSIHYLFWTLV